MCFCSCSLNLFNTFTIKNKWFLLSENVYITITFLGFLWLYCIFFLSVTLWIRFRWRFGSDATRAFEVAARCCETAHRWFFTFTRRVETPFEKTSITADCSGGVAVLVRAVWLHQQSRGGAARVHWALTRSRSGPSTKIVLPLNWTVSGGATSRGLWVMGRKPLPSLVKQDH